MIRLDRVELLHWDVQPHQVLPLARGITLLTGENGSGKTSVLDGIKVALGVMRLGGDRDVQKYLAKQARAVAMVRVVADNRPLAGSRQRPFDRLGEFSSDLVTLAVVFRAEDAVGYQHEHYLLDGDVVPPLDGKRRSVQSLPSGSDYRQRLAKVGLTERYLKLLSLPQGQIASLCKKDPGALFDDLYDIIGGRQTLEAWEERLDELRKAQVQHDAVDKDLKGARIQLDALEARVRRHEDWRRTDSRHRAVEAALPHVELRESRTRVERLREQIARLEAEIAQLVDTKRIAVGAAKDARNGMTTRTARRMVLKREIIDMRRAREAVVKRLAAAEAQLEVLEELRHAGEAIDWEDIDRLRQSLDDLRTRRATLAAEIERRAEARAQANRDLDGVSAGILPLPREVERFRARLKAEGIAHDLLHEVVELDDPAWQGAIEGYLGRYRFAVLVRDLPSWSRAAAIARVEKYPHGVLAPDVRGHSPQDQASIARRLHVQDPDYRALVARLLRPVLEGEAAEPIEPMARGELLSPSGFAVSRIEARHAWASDVFLGREALRQRAEQLKTLLAELVAQDDIALVTDADLKREIKAVERRVGDQEARRKWEEARPRHAELRETVAELSENIERRAAEIDGKEKEAEILDEELRSLEGEASKHEANAKTGELAAAKKDDERSKLDGESAQAETSLGRLLAAPPPEAKDAIRGVLDEGHSLVTLKGQIAELATRATQFSDDERDPMLPVNHQRQRSEVVAVEDRLTKLAASVEQTRQAADRAHRDYQQATRLVFRGFFARLTSDAKKLGYGVEGELLNAETGRFKCEVRVGVDEKAVVSYASPDLSGGQKAALSILMAMTAVSLDSAESAGFFLVDEPFSASDVYKINELGDFLERTRSQYLISMPTSSDVAQCGAWLSAIWTSTKSPGGFDAAGRPVLAPPVKLGFASGARDG